MEVNLHYILILITLTCTSASSGPFTPDVASTSLQRPKPSESNARLTRFTSSCDQRAPRPRRTRAVPPPP
jgi:hypothetical protein